MKSSYSKRGFTLIEILVAIAIIGVLASVFLMSGSEARAVARDNARINDLEQMRIALRLYYEAHGRYPESCANTATEWGADHNTMSAQYNCDSDEPYILGAPGRPFVGVFMEELPIDPKSDGNRGYMYRVSTNGSSYKLLAHRTVEVKMVEDYGEPYARCAKKFAVGDLPPGVNQGDNACRVGLNADSFRNIYAIYAGPISASW